MPASPHRERARAGSRNHPIRTPRSSSETRPPRSRDARSWCPCSPRPPAGDGRDRHPLGVGGNTDTTSVHLATEAVVFPKTNEVFVSDGYGNRRVLVLDAETLAFKRMWGAFGKQPPPTLGRGVNADANRVTTTDPRGPEHFNSVHAVKV